MVFDYRTYLKHEGIYRIANLSSITEIRQQSSLSFFERLHELRRQAIVSIQRNFPAPMQHYMTGLLFGYLDKSFDEMSDVYTSLGIIHLFALSGMQVGFFVALFSFYYFTSWVTARLCGYTANPVFTCICWLDRLFGISDS